MESKFDYKLVDKAVSDLNGIVLYITNELCNPQAASKFIDKLANKIEDIRIYPESGSPVHNEFLENIRKQIVGNYIMYYYPDMDNRIIYILRIVYAKRDMNEILIKLSI